MRSSAVLLACLVGAACSTGEADRGATAPTALRPEPLGVPMDGLPAGRSARGAWTAEVQAGGRLQVRGPTGDAVDVDSEVRAELDLHLDPPRLAYAAQAEGEDSDLFVVELEPLGEPRAVTDWGGAEDRPHFSPDGRALVFVSGRTGIASLWGLRLDAPERPAVQLTNLGLEHQQRNPGQAPVGFVPPPDGGPYAWTDEGLRWTTRRGDHAVEAAVLRAAGLME
jgi:hypothetical protein